MAAPEVDAPRLLRAAREDAGMTQRALADAVGARQPHIAGIESGRRPVSADLLDRLLTATDYRPSLALAEQRDALIDLGLRHGVSEIRVFGSVARGADHHSSDIDLLVRFDRAADPLAFPLFVAEATDLLGFPVDVVVDSENVHPHIASTAVRL
ncbi:XRE family transcriptional regulator [Brachybacterium ginsengisoli]|uniref:XRE family transcriptional regulator n=1 Tax=Brachybacterium ginsengisoli TaxID=1331682 RepID=A0A291GUA5_9MICO|nr:XRE family transcriptional regulator [Brachybacterium ginsengisoli]ATG53742.1 XRE family transcriptional regulator [Brachybacterium ginsengisoli]